jgi:hypothetical protein
MRDARTNPKVAAASRRWGGERRWLHEGDFDRINKIYMMGKTSHETTLKTTSR